MKPHEYPNPWQTKNSTVVYDNNWITVSHREVINPNGGNGIYGVVSFKNIAIGIIPLDSKQNTWLVGQYRYTVGEYSWEIPMGGGKKENTVLESAQRELLEETGLTANTWNELLKLHTSNSVTDEVAYVLVATDLQQGIAQPEETEDLKIRKLPFTEVVEMVMRGEITDAISVAGILKLNALLHKNYGEWLNQK